MNQIAIIKQCPEKDKDSRPNNEQKFCLYTSDGSRLLGRHPSKEKARQQEKAIQKHKHSKIIQLEFCKLAVDWWNDLTIKEQKEYLRNHPKSNLRVRRKDVPVGSLQYYNGRYRLLTHDRGWIYFDPDEKDDLNQEKYKTDKFLNGSK